MKKARKMIGISSRFLFVLFVLVVYICFCNVSGRQGQLDYFLYHIAFCNLFYLLFFYPLSEMTVERIIRTPHVQNGGKFIVSLTVKRKVRFPLLYTVATEKWAEP